MLKSNIKLTVIIPFLNEGDEVENTLSSIRQTAGNQTEILIINDASTDGVDYRSVARKYQVIYLKNNKRMGVAASRDKGISLITTPYFLLLDAHMRFYQKDWVEQIVAELEKDDRVLLCCNTKVLSKDVNGKLDESNHTPAFGAVVNLQGNKWMLNAEWSVTEKQPGTSTEDIACVLGAGYAASKRYWQYLRGLEGLIYYGSDETYISLKVWLEGGRCRLLKNIRIGHIYWTQAPYKIEHMETIFNKLWIAELLLPFSYRLRTFGALYEENPEKFEEAYTLFRKKKQLASELKAYYGKIFTRHFQTIVQMNARKIPANQEYQQKKQEKLAQWFKKLLLNCNTLPSDGLWYGRMGCLLFLAKYDHTFNNDLYEGLIGELIDEIYTRIANSSPNIDFGEGLCGIAYGLAWLLDQHLMEGDVNDVLEEADRRIMERDPLRISDYSLASGLAGILYYVLYRLQIAQKRHLTLPFDAPYLSRLHRAALKALRTPGKMACYEMASWLTAYRQDPALKLEIPDIIQLLNLSALRENTATYRGLKDGLAGLGLSKSNE